MIPRLNMHFSLNDLFAMFRKQKNPLIEDDTYYLNHARTGISIAIGSLNLPVNSGIGVMAYNCHTVMNAVGISGYEIIFIDIDKNLRLNVEDLSAKVEKFGISVLIVSHLFGIVSDVNKIKTLYPNLIIIEDCAHAFGSKFPDGSLAGDLGDFSVYSVGLGKFPSIGDGGILHVNNKKYIEPVAQIVGKLPQSTLKNDIKIILKNTVNHILYQPFLYGWFTLPIKRQNKNQVLRHIKVPEIRKRMTQGVKNRFFREISNVEDYCMKQQENAKQWKIGLSQLKIFSSIKIYIDEYSNCFMLPVWCEDKSLFINEMKKKGVEVATHFEQAVIWAKEFGYIDGSCPMSEELINHLVIVPCHYNLSSKKIKKILNKK